MWSMHPIFCGRVTRSVGANRQMAARLNHLTASWWRSNDGATDPRLPNRSDPGANLPVAYLSNSLRFQSMPVNGSSGRFVGCWMQIQWGEMGSRHWVCSMSRVGAQTQRQISYSAVGSSSSSSSSSSAAAAVAAAAAAAAASEFLSPCFIFLGILKQELCWSSLPARVPLVVIIRPRRCWLKSADQLFDCILGKSAISSFLPPLSSLLSFFLEINDWIYPPEPEEEQKESFQFQLNDNLHR